MRPVTTLLVAIVLAACPALGAQQVRGVVVDSAAGAPVPGAVVMALDARGAMRARTITGTNGRFALSVGERPAAVRVIRIGYAPRQLSLGGDATDGQLRIAMQRLPATLSTVRVTDRELCPGSAERGAAFELWEQARAGLLAAVVTREAKPANATVLTFERTLSPDDQLVRRMHLESKTGSTTRPFIAPEPAAAFAAHGYMREDDDRSRDFAAPDADVLLDESFASVHCFHLQNGDAAHPGEIGLAFTPVGGRDTLVDVAGVIWMDRAEPALRSLDFRYTSLEPAARSAGAGGHIEFRAMANGVSFIDRWIMHLPALTEERSRERTIREAVRFKPRRATDYSARVSAIVETGGEVLSAKWTDGAAWTSTRTGIAGRVTSAGRSASGAVVALENTEYRATANANGDFSIDHVIPGVYTLIVTDTTLLDYVDERRTTRPIHVLADSVAHVAVDLPRMSEMIEKLCRGQDRPRNTAVVLGQIVTERGVPETSVHLAATWLANVNGGVPIDAGRTLTMNRASRDLDVDEQGRFTLCGVAPDRPVHLRASPIGGTGADRAHADTIIVVPSDSAMQIVRWAPAIAGRSRPE